MTNPQIKTQAKLHIYDGISVETVKQQGSDGQKIAPYFSLIKIRLIFNILLFEKCRVQFFAPLTFKVHFL